MKSGYKILWTDNAVEELENTIQYLEANFGDKVLTRLAHKIESILRLISDNPYIFSESEFKGVRKASILKYNTLYYRINSDVIEILSFFSNRQSPDKRSI